ncbi:OLC1v1005113C1 [Oldenlandia corymbosa var. corymbosa]|uniref:OLC1v1005113C1 n=1 Tax=Oldenlandia corymbosa var. corymbosa TaxID=529605 RepID=A0AAV1DE34_OLDCO|nr:OLC1v1005113C1 [Oldenlandia corymbosa var. corymbosa]
MSPASKSKSKDKKTGKEPSKASSKPSNHASTGGGIPASGYNPLLGTFHTIETAPLSSAAPLHVNGRFRNIDESDDQSGNSFGNGVEYDSISNNGSWSGDSEEHKDKPSHLPIRQETVPGADNDKREKIRQKNERKHQRQKERRAQELHERCSGYLMSRKLEALAQQLVGMGFTQERATMALILNEGRVEASVAWLFEEGQEADKHKEHNLDSGSNLKIDISEELARIADMEIRYKCSKQEVERAIVACEGDLDKAEETLKVQKQDPPPSVPPKPEETGDPPTVSNSKLPVPANPNLLKAQPKPPSAIMIQQKRDEKDFNYTKATVTSGPLVDPANKNLQSLKRIPPKMDWAKPQQIGVPAEKRWPLSSSNPSVSYSLASSLQASAPPAKTESRYVPGGSELKNLQIGSVREPVIVMQRPQSMNGKQNPSSSVTSSSPGPTMGWYPNSVETLKSNGIMPPVSGARNPSPNSVSTNQMYNQFQYQPQQFVSSSGAMDSPGATRANGLWNRAGTSSTLAPASNLGLFAGLGMNGASGSSSPVDWSTGGSMGQLDYTNIDWSLNPGSSMSRPGLWQGMNSFMQHDNPRTYDSFSSGMGVKPSMRPILSNGSAISMSGMQDVVSSTETSSTSGSREWTSPFEEKDLFSLPRQFVSSPSL